MAERNKDVLTPDEVAQHLKCGRTKTYELIAQNAIPSFRVGRLRRVRLADLEAYIDEQVHAATPGR